VEIIHKNRRYRIFLEVKYQIRTPRRLAPHIAMLRTRIVHRTGA
jgi:hypothetical protein